MNDYGEFTLRPAVRENVPALIGIFGRAKSGKTHSALLLARGMVGENGIIAMIDTEARRSEILVGWPGIGDFLIAEIKAPFSSARYYDALKAVIAQTPDCIIIDCQSHEHEGEGGLLDFADREGVRLGSTAHGANWKLPKADRNRLNNLLVTAPCHVILTIRKKYVSDMKVKGPEKPKVLRDVCDPDLEFQLTLAIDLEPMTHNATFRSPPAPLAPACTSTGPLTNEIGTKIAAVLGEGAEPDTAFETAMSYAEDAARTGGVKALTDYTAQLEEDMKAKLRAHWPRLKQIATSFKAPEEAEDSP